MNYYQGKNKWFDTHWADKITPEFADWWKDSYGTPEAFLLGMHDYFLYMTLAFMGWEARRVLYEEQENE
jgi:hypothetical protein